MRKVVFLASLVALAGCDTFPVHGNSARQSDAAGKLAAALAGEYDNKQQADSGGGIPHVQEILKPLSGNFWSWQLQSASAQNPAKTTWLYRLETNAKDGSIKLTPFRALDEKAIAALAEKDKKFEFVATQWAELTPCTQTGTWQGSHFQASADAPSCSALLPGLGESAALLPLSIGIDGDMLATVTFADQARGASARIDARRVRWFDGWAVINGAGPKAKGDSSDWHMRKDLKLSSEGGRVPVRWRDGAASGYSLELVRKTYAERKQNVLQLDVIDDATGQVISYVWANPETSAIGLNLGWLQVGLNQASNEKP
jgi:hypothetical protein